MSSIIQFLTNCTTEQLETIEAEFERSKKTTMITTTFKDKEQLLIECESQKKSLYSHLIYDGKLSIKNAYSLFGISNISHEVRRQIEKPLDIELKRVKKVGKTRYKSRATGLNTAQHHLIRLR